jgi:uncharacterized protein
MCRERLVATLITFVSSSVLAVSAAAQGPGGAQATQIRPGEQCPPGMTEIRPRNCMAPQLPAPSILDYRPRSTLVTPSREVPRAKFPVIDFHGHMGQRITSAEGLVALEETLDALNVRLMIAADNLSGERLRQTVATIDASPAMRDRVRVFAGVDFRNVGPGWAERAVRQLEEDVAAGAVGIGEISKGLGLSITRADGTRLRIDDPDLDPIWRAAARLGVPVFIHTADPPEFFEPIDHRNERWLELALFPSRHYPQDRFPGFEQLATERDNLFRRHPQTTFVTAHLGWHGNDLARLGRMFDEMPNVYAEVGAVLYDIGRQPRVARDFFIRYQDRLLFGKDSFQPEEYPYFWRVFETSDDYFDYYRPYHAFWKLYGIDLPDAVLRKVYYQNALRITPGLPRTAWARFLENLGAHCGQAFRGRLALTPEGDPMLTGTEELLVHFRDCEPDEVRIPFHVEVEATGQWNRSRTWYVMTADQGLELRHDHREPNGSESTRTWYGGFTRSQGTATRQDFLSPERTAAAGVPVGWRIEIEPGAWYRYGTTRDGQYDWMIEFDLARPTGGEIPAAWGAHDPPSRTPGPP